VAPAPPMQGKAVGRAVVTILAVRTALAVGTMRAVAALRLLGLLLRLAAGDERRQTLDVFIIDLLMLRPRLAVALSLRLMLLARIKRLRFARRERLAADRGLVVAVVISLVGNIAALVAALLVIGLALPKLFLGGGDQAEIMLGVLIVIFGRYGVAGTLRIARKLEIFLRDVRRRTADLHVRSVGLVHARQRILVMTTFSVATAHSLVLTVSHDLLSRQPPGLRQHGCRRLTAQSPTVSRQFDARIRAVFFVHRSCDSTSKVPTIQPSPAALPHVANPSWRATFINARKTDETSRSESGDPVCRPIRRLLFRLSLFRLSFH
jgi:hypothetical protein